MQFCLTLSIALLAVLLGVFYQVRIPMDLTPTNLEGKLYLITGCTPNGIGYEAVQVLLQWNASVVCTMRGSKQLPPQPRLSVVNLDLLSLHSVREAATVLRRDFGRFTGIVLNAGTINANFTVSEDGFESTFQSNHLSQFYLLQLLLDRMVEQREEEGRVVFVSSGLHRLGAPHAEFEHKPAVLLNEKGQYDCWATYAHTKYFNVLAANAFAKRFPGIHFFSVSPGMVRTNLEGLIETAPDSVVNKLFMSMIGRSVKDGAVRTLQALTNPIQAEQQQHGVAQHIDDYIKLPRFSLVNEENADWLYKTSNALLLLEEQ